MKIYIKPEIHDEEIIIEDICISSNDNGFMDDTTGHGMGGN